MEWKEHQHNLPSNSFSLIASFKFVWDSMHSVLIDNLQVATVTVSAVNLVAFVAYMASIVPTNAPN